MNKKTLIVAISAGLLTLLGCEKKENAPPPAPAASTQNAPATDPNAYPNSNAQNAPNQQAPQNAQPMQNEAPMQAQNQPMQNAPADQQMAQQPAPAPEPPQPLVVPSGRSIPIILGQTLNSKSNGSGARVHRHLGHEHFGE